jgi:hypothetical protein
MSGWTTVPMEAKIKVEGLPDNAPTIEISGDNITINVNSGDRDHVVSELSSQLERAKEANERLTKLANNRYGEIAEAFKRLHEQQKMLNDANAKLAAVDSVIETIRQKAGTSNYGLGWRAACDFIKSEIDRVPCQSSKT